MDRKKLALCGGEEDSSPSRQVGFSIDFSASKDAFEEVIELPELFMGERVVDELSDSGRSSSRGEEICVDIA